MSNNPVNSAPRGSSGAEKATGRTKARFNAYLPHNLVSWGEEHAASAFKTARKPKGETLSFLIERLLLRYKASVKRKADARAAIAKKPARKS